MCNDRRSDEGNERGMINKKNIYGDVQVLCVYVCALISIVATLLKRSGMNSIWQTDEEEVIRMMKSISLHFFLSND